MKPSEPDPSTSARAGASRGWRWADLMRGALALDVLARPRCGGRLLLAVFEASAVTARILHPLVAAPLRRPTGIIPTLSVMTLQPGDRLGPYEVRSALGAGGMGEVYRARDTKLGRDVAIKILPSHFTSDPDRLARFEREARVLASLNHPHIGAIYGLEDADGVRALVLELVQGETLADRIARGPIPLNDALAIARQIVDALDAAHERGIVHRDLKPANIKITPDHKAKVLDFGLAKAVASGDATADLTQSPTMTAGTCAGVILGTAAYMSPEQARGLTVDKRTDIWAFGCVLYEMLSRRAASRATQSPTRWLPSSNASRTGSCFTSTPQSVQKLLARCLQKDPKQRLRDIADAHTQLDVDSDSTRVAGPSRRRFGTLSWVAALATMVGLAAFVAATSILRPRAVPPVGHGCHGRID